MKIKGVSGQPCKNELRNPEKIFARLFGDKYNSILIDHQVSFMLFKCVCFGIGGSNIAKILCAL